MSSEDEALAWLRAQINARTGVARQAIARGAIPAWRELIGGVPADGPWPLAYAALTGLVEANGPQDTLARCETELAILDEHRLSLGLRHPLTDSRVAICAACRVPEMLRGEWRGVETLYPCKTVRLLASGYRHREGWAEHWSERK